MLLTTTLYVLEVTRAELEDLKEYAKDTAEDTKKIKENLDDMKILIENSMHKNNLADPEVPTHGELYSICFILNP